MADLTTTPTLDSDMVETAEHATNEPDANRDPLTGAAGAHPIGTGVGAAGGAVAGAAIGAAVGGPVGFAVGGAAGAVAGGLVGKAAGEVANPTDEDAYWREQYPARPYTNRDLTYEVYQPAYRYGWEAYALHPGKQWDDVERDLASGWSRARGMTALEWEDARLAAKDAWERVERYDRKHT
jgi:hypothetical protein